MSRHVSFGTVDEIPYERTYDGGYAYNAVKVAKQNQDKNKRRTFELILKPDNFSIDLVVENPSGLYNSGHTCDPSSEDGKIGRLSRSKTM